MKSVIDETHSSAKITCGGGCIYITMFRPANKIALSIHHFRPATKRHMNLGLRREQQREAQVSNIIQKDNIANKKHNRKILGG